MMKLVALKSCVLISSLFAALLLLTFEPSRCAACTETEQRALLTFKHSLHDPSNKLSSWGDGKVNCCRWKGVLCSSISSSSLTGHVEGLQLQSGLNGTVSSSLLDLKHLRYLDLSRNNFHQPIPSFIGSLASLEYLNLSHAEFYGKIPYSIGNLSKLHTLSLEETRSTPSLLQADSLEWLWGLSKLEHLNLNGVNLSQAHDWEQVIFKLPSLVHLRLSSCILSDSAPLSNDVNISRSNLDTLDLSSNSFVSEWIFRLANLNFLDLSVNSFEGPIPTNANFTRLQHVNLSENYFNSTIPDWLYSCENLEFVNLGSNNLQGNISTAIENLTSLTTLVLSHNELSGEIPREIGSLCKMQRLDLSYNKLGGNISDSSFENVSSCFLGSLEFLDLSMNQLSGHLTHMLGSFKRLGALMLGRNSLSGVIPSNIGNLSSLQSLDMSYNRLSGNLPESVGQLFNLKGLLLHFNMLEGVVTEAHFARLSKLTVLSASGNHLTLNISNPDWIPPFKLETLLLGLWSLGSDSRIFSWLGTQQSSILELDLSSTGISSDVPSWLWSVKYLNLSYNQLHGQIPVISDPKIDDVNYGRFIYLSSNNFSGPLPRVGNKVSELDLSNNSFSGGISHFVTPQLSI
ncbi:disease resistance family protein / LRR family protein [Striga hermonthica]|uniref:Disease resistance family protein / LRR family protein n=1 Tax=Striga hermonthica TaxID=68872 RepID=A0A9N7R629_STRHE|nr:disease resistance family protein / LRR family protein [Striga hermonthica]